MGICHLSLITKPLDKLCVVHSGFSRRAGDRRFSPCTKVYHAGYKFWIHFIFGTTLNVSTKETKRFLLSAYKVLCKCRICSYKCCRFSKFPGGACSRTLLDDPPLTSILSPPTMPHLGEPCPFFQKECPSPSLPHLFSWQVSQDTRKPICYLPLA